MKLYYNGKGYPVKWKSLTKKNMWYNMEPVKLKFTLPESVYNVILLDIKLDTENKNLRDIFRFNLLLQEGELSRNSDKLVVENSEYWKVESFLNRVSISSRFRNGDVTAIFEVSIFNQIELDRIAIREVLLNELL
jgi:hypothetical protein